MSRNPPAFEVQVVHLNDLTYGSQIELVPPGTPVWAVQVRRLTASLLPDLALRFGTQGRRFRIRGQGDGIRNTAEPFDSGVYLSMLPRRGSTALATQKGPLGAFVQVVYALGPGLDIRTWDQDPWDLAVSYSGPGTAAAGAGQIPVVRLGNDQHLAIQGALPFMAKLSNLVISSSVAGEISIFKDPNVAAAGGTFGGVAHFLSGTGFVSSRAVGSTGTPGAAEGAFAPLYRFDIPAGTPIELPVDFELGPPDNAGEQRRILVNGPAAATLKVTFEWKEVDLSTEGLSAA